MLDWFSTPPEDEGASIARDADEDAARDGHGSAEWSVGAPPDVGRASGSPTVAASSVADAGSDGVADGPPHPAADRDEEIPPSSTRPVDEPEEIPASSSTAQAPDVPRDPTGPSTGPSRSRDERLEEITRQLHPRRPVREERVAASPQAPEAHPEPSPAPVRPEDDPWPSATSAIPAVSAPDAVPAQGDAAPPQPTDHPQARPQGDAPVALDAMGELVTRDAVVVCIANQKGGVGKTTTAVSLAAALAEAGAQVLLVDLDPQGNATTGLGLRVHEGQPSSYTVLVEELAIEDAVEPTAVRGLHVLPSSLDLAGAEIELVPAFSRELRLKRALDAARDLYDLVVVDCPPTLGLLTVNALAAADEVLLPIQCEYYALEGVGQLTRSIDMVRRSLNPDLRVGGVVLTMFDARTRLAQQVVDEVRDHFGPVVYRTVVPRTVRLSEAPGFGQPITTFDPSSRGARAYLRLADEVAERLGLDVRALSPLDHLIGDPQQTTTEDERE